MEKPFLEISVVSKTDENLTIIDVLEQIKGNIMNYPANPPESVVISSKPSIIFTFSDLEHFKAMYEKDYRIYSYLYEKVLRQHVDLSSSIFKAKSGKMNASTSTQSTAMQKNYIVLRYHSNNLAPMRRNYQLIYKVNEIFGFRVTNEEVQDGFVRFIKTKEDYDGMFVGRDEVEKWIEVFRLFEIDLTHPSILKFIEILKSFLK